MGTEREEHVRRFVGPELAPGQSHVVGPELARGLAGRAVTPLTAGRVVERVSESRRGAESAPYHTAATKVGALQSQVRRNETGREQARALLQVAPILLNSE